MASAGQVLRQFESNRDSIARKSLSLEGLGLGSGTDGVGFSLRVSAGKVWLRRAALLGSTFQAFGPTTLGLQREATAARTRFIIYAAHDHTHLEYDRPGSGYFMFSGIGPVDKVTGE